MNISEIRSLIEDIERDTSLFEEKNFDRRNEALDFIGFPLIDPIGGPAETAELSLLKHRAEK